MAEIKSAASLLRSADFLKNNDKAQKHVKHEFQDYAYRLALKLGDLQHRPIYMRLAKRVPRHLLEQALALASDHTKEVSKGKLFMWYLADLTHKDNLKKLKANNDPVEIADHMTVLADSLALEIEAKAKQNANDYCENLLHRLIVTMQDSLPKRAKPTALFVCPGSAWEGDLFSRWGWRAQVLETSNVLAKRHRRSKRSKVIKKRSFFDNSYKANSIQFLMFNYRFWDHLPKSMERNAIAEAFRLLSPNGLLAIPLLEGESSEGWHDFVWKDKEYTQFIKVSQADELCEYLSEFGFTFLEEAMWDKKHRLMIAKLATKNDPDNKHSSKKKQENNSTSD